MNERSPFGIIETRCADCRHAPIFETPYYAGDEVTIDRAYAAAETALNDHLAALHDPGQSR
jgi:hypothetical protein